MNYQSHYDRLMARAPKVRITGEYLEGHHVIPECMGGKDGPIAYLTPEEHYVAHQLLVKIYPGNNKLTLAAHMMGAENNKSFGWLRRLSSLAMIGNKHGSGNRNKPKSESHKIAISKSTIGLKKPPLSTEHKAKIGARWLGKKRGPMSDIHKAKVSASKKGRPWTAARRQSQLQRSI